LFFSPLREIPGPLLAKITPYWLIFIDMAGNRTSRLHRLHEQYGPTIRVGPNEVSFSNQEIVKEIYGQQTAFMKAPVYDSMSVPPIGIFSFRNKQQHSQRRRLLSHAFSQANISHTEPLIREHIKCFVDLMDQKLGVPVDVFTTFRTLSFDIVGEYHGILLACGLLRDTII
jgi:cytochrome P450